MPTAQRIFLVACSLFLMAGAAQAESREIFEAGGNLSSLVLDCKPLYAIEDQRVPVTEIQREHHQGKVFYLFSNHDLAFWQVELYNNFLSPMKLEKGEFESWGQAVILELESLETGEAVPATFEILERKVSRTILYRNGNPITEFDLEPSPSGGAAKILTPHDRRKRKYVPSKGEFPEQIKPRETFRLLVRIIFPKELTRGAYRVNFHDRLTGEDCHLQQVVVVGEPRTPRDRVDDYLVRYRYYMEQGLEEAAEFEVRAATREVPSSITAWTERASFASQTGDLEDYLVSAKKLRELLLNLEEGQSYDKFGILFAQDMVVSIPEVEAKLQKRQDEGGSAEEP